MYSSWLVIEQALFQPPVLPRENPSPPLTRWLNGLQALVALRDQLLDLKGCPGITLCFGRKHGNNYLIWKNVWEQLFDLEGYMGTSFWFGKMLGGITFWFGRMPRDNLIWLPPPPPSFPSLSFNINLLIWFPPAIKTPARRQGPSSVDLCTSLEWSDPTAKLCAREKTSQNDRLTLVQEIKCELKEKEKEKEDAWKFPLDFTVSIQIWIWSLTIWMNLDKWELSGLASIQRRVVWVLPPCKPEQRS